MPTFWTRTLSPLAAVAAVLLVALMASALLAGHAGFFRRFQPGGRPSGDGSSGTGPVATDQYRIVSLIPAGPHDVWALGSETDALCVAHPQATRVPVTPTPSLKSDPACAPHALLLRWDGQRWHRIYLSGEPGIDQVSVLPSGEAFAIAGSDLLHMQNGVWSVEPNYFSGAFSQVGMSLTLEGFAMVSPHEGWAYGYGVSADTNPPVLAHYLNGHWTLVPLPDAPRVGAFQAISMLSPSEGWAVGVAFEGSDQMVLIERYHDGRWSRIDPQIAGSLNAVQTLPSGDVWAVGSENPSFGPGLILHWSNGRWSKVQTGLQDNILHDLDMLSPTEGWVVGDGAQILHLHNGAWIHEGQVVHGFETDVVAMVSPTEGWAAGEPCCSSAPSGPFPSLLHDQDSTWTMIPVRQIVAHAVNG
jgi:hypothetical protein